MHAPQSGFRVPGWAVAAATAITTLIGSGIFLGIKLEAQSSQNVSTNYRLCRIEKALGIDPWILCELPVSQPGGQRP